MLINHSFKILTSMFLVAGVMTTTGCQTTTSKPIDSSFPAETYTGEYLYFGSGEGKDPTGRGEVTVKLWRDDAKWNGTIQVPKWKNFGQWESRLDNLEMSDGNISFTSTGYNGKMLRVTGLKTDESIAGDISYNTYDMKLELTRVRE